jgi:hypothetical protein
MEEKYFHDHKEKKLYRMPSCPEIVDVWQKNEIVGYTLKIKISVTIADNYLIKGHWKYACEEFFEQFFDSKRYTKEQSVSYFLMNHTPKYDEISREDYNIIHLAYDLSAKEIKNKLMDSR